MGFRDEFFLTQKTYAQWSLERTVDTGFRAERDELVRLQNAQRSAYEAAADRIVRSQTQAAALLKDELEYQSERIVEAIERGSADIVASIQETCDHLGGELVEIRWSIERHATLTQKVLEVLLSSLDNTSRQYFEQGVKCYEAGETAFARERFTKALEVNRTNYFAYQYIGFIAVSEEDADEAIRNFELAQKFAEQAYHRALALSHLARAKRAIGDAESALTLSRTATTLSPDTPKFWYELANHCATLRHDQEMAAALQNAIERDWEYFTVAASDAALEPCRSQVIQLLADLRTREGTRARHCLDRLRQALTIAKTVGAEQETRDCAAALLELEKKHSRNNVFIHREIQNDALTWKRTTLQTAQQVVEKKIAANRGEALRCEADKKKRIEVWPFRSFCRQLNGERQFERNKWLGGLDSNHVHSSNELTLSERPERACFNRAIYWINAETATGRAPRQSMRTVFRSRIDPYGNTVFVSDYAVAFQISRAGGSSLLRGRQCGGPVRIRTQLPLP